MDKRVAIIILLILIIINLVFFILFIPQKSQELKSNYSEGSEEVIFIQKKDELNVNGNIDLQKTGNDKEEFNSYDKGTSEESEVDEEQVDEKDSLEKSITEEEADSSKDTNTPMPDPYID